MRIAYQQLQMRNELLLLQSFTIFDCWCCHSTQAGRSTNNGVKQNYTLHLFSKRHKGFLNKKKIVILAKIFSTKKDSNNLLHHKKPELKRNFYQMKKLLPSLASAPVLSITHAPPLAPRQSISTAVKSQS